MYFLPCIQCNYYARFIYIAFLNFKCSIRRINAKTQNFFSRSGIRSKSPSFETERTCRRSLPLHLVYLTDEITPAKYFFILQDFVVIPK